MEEDKIEQLRYQLSLQLGVELNKNQALSIGKVINEYNGKLNDLKTDDETYNEGIDKGFGVGVECAMALIGAIK